MADLLLPTGSISQGVSTGLLPSGDVLVVVASGPTNGTGSGFPPAVSLGVPAASAAGTGGGGTNGTAAGTLSALSASAPAGSALGTGAGNGTITIPAVKDWNTGSLKTSETGVIAIINDVTTGALVVKKTGQTTHATTGVCVVTDALLIVGTTYRVTTIFADGSEGTWRYPAA